MRIRLIAFLGVLGLTIVAAIIGNVLELKGILTREEMGPQGIAAVMGVYVGLFCLLCLTIVPLALRIFIAGQIRIGNGERSIIKWLREHEKTVVVAFWCLFMLGLAIIYVLARDQILNDLAG